MGRLEKRKHEEHDKAGSLGRAAIDIRFDEARYISYLRVLYVTV